MRTAQSTRVVASPPKPSLTLSHSPPLPHSITHSITHSQFLTETDTVPYDGGMGPGRWDSNRTPARPLRRGKGTLGEEDGRGEEGESSAGKGKKRTKKILSMTDEEWCPSSDLSFATIGKMAFVWVVGPSLRVIRKVPTLASLWRVRPWTQDARAIGEGRWRCHGPSLHPEREERHPFLAEIVDRRNDATALSCPRITDRNGLRRTIPSFRRVSSMDVSSSSPFLDRRRTQRLFSLVRSVYHPRGGGTNAPRTSVDDLEEEDAHPFPCRHTSSPPSQLVVHLQDVGYGYGYVALGREGGRWATSEAFESSSDHRSPSERETTCDSET